ncbi:MAG: hypothetical protein KDA96_12320 [Planctomycetaceae bacterium]|nr:hypothetical protein [Planctomycetaceae bacterium]
MAVEPGQLPDHAVLIDPPRTMARKRHNNSISLFPFLAVLVCTMGALILILLVTTRQIRNDQIQASRELPDPPEQHPSRAAEIDPELIALDQRTPSREELALQTADLDAGVRRLDQLRRQLLLDSNQADRLREELATAAAALEKMRESLRELKSEISQLDARAELLTRGDQPSILAALVREAADLRREEATLRVTLNRLAAKMAARQQELEDSRFRLATSEARLAETRSALLRIHSEVDRRRELPNAIPVSGTETRIEFSNSTGTTKHPVLVNAVKDGLQLLPSGEMIRLSDIEDCDVIDSPLVSAVRMEALNQARRQNVKPQPYVLVLVRPDGCLSFYAAQVLLTSNQIPFGYELVDQDLVVDAGECTDEDKDRVHEAVVSCLGRSHRRLGREIETAEAGAPPDDRGYVISSQGEVRRVDDPVALFDNRVYAGGFAPPPRSRHRPAGGYQNVVKNQLPARGQSSQHPPANGQPLQQLPANGQEVSSMTGQPVLPDLDVDTDALRDQLAAIERLIGEPGEFRFAENPIDGQTSGAPRQQSKTNLFGAGGSMTSQFMVTDAEGASFDWSGDASVKDPSGAADLSKLDPAVLQQLRGMRSPGQDLAMPIGITVYVDAEHLTVEQQEPVFVGNRSRSAILYTLLTSVNHELDAVRISRRERYLPVIRFVVSPGGERLRMLLSAELRRLSIYHATTISLEPHIHVAGETGIVMMSDIDAAEEQNSSVVEGRE